MQERVKRIGGAMGTALLWGVAWAAVGALFGIVTSRAGLERLWLGPPIGMQPGLLAGVVFAAVLGFAAGRRRLGEWSFPGVIQCGAVAGLLVGALPFAINQPPSDAPPWLVFAVVVGSMALLGAASAAGSLALTRAIGRPMNRPSPQRG